MAGGVLRAIRLVRNLLDLRPNRVLTTAGNEGDAQQSSMTVDPTTGAVTIHGALSASGVASVDGVQFNLDPSCAIAEGLIRWNSDDGTVEIGMPGGNVTLQVGQEMIARVKNDSGVAISDGQPVQIAGGVGAQLLVELADASVYASAQATVGLATEDIADGQFGYVTLVGMVRDADTSAWAVGTILYISTVAGVLSSTAAVAPNASIAIGLVVRSHATEGVIGVRVSPPKQMDGLSDVSAGSPVDLDILQWDNAASYWKNVTIPTAMDGTYLRLDCSNDPLTEDLTLTKGLVVNEGGGDNDTRIEVVGNANGVYVDASTGKVGIGTSTPAYWLTVYTSAVSSFGCVSTTASGVYYYMENTSRRWRFGINGPGNFLLEDLTGATVPVIIEKAMPTNSLFGESTGALWGFFTNAPKSKVDIVGSLGALLEQKAASFTAADAHTYECDCTAGAIVATLPAATTCTSRIYNFQKSDGSANSLTIQGNGAETINGSNTQVIYTQFTCLTVQSNGTSWVII